MTEKQGRTLPKLNSTPEFPSQSLQNRARMQYQILQISSPTNSIAEEHRVKHNLNPSKNVDISGADSSTYRLIDDQTERMLIADISLSRSNLPFSKLEDIEKFGSPDQTFDEAHSLLKADATRDKKKAYKRLLKRAGLVCYFIGIMQVYMNRVKVYGAIRSLDHLKKIAQEKEKPKEPLRIFPLQPSSTIKLGWTLNILIWLVFSGLTTPYEVAFVDTDTFFWIVVDYVLDGMFFIDIIINFLSAYVDDKHNAIITDWKIIAKKYLYSWFIIDAIAVFPFDALSNALSQSNPQAISQGSYNKLLRLLRLPRLYRLVKIFRIMKLFRIGGSTHSLRRIFKNMNVNIGVFRMLRVLMNVLFLTHLVACLWFFIAKVNNFDPTTWVYKASLVDSDSFTQYVASYYWAIQTLTTVGYGDIPPDNPAEWAVASVWMIIGIALYSFAIGNLSSILSNLDKGSSILQNKLNSFNTFSMKVGLPNFLRHKIQTYTEINHRENVYTWLDPQELLKELPTNLRSHLILFSYAKMIRHIRLLKIDPNFTATICPFLKILTLRMDEIIYREEDPSMEIFFITKGAISLIDDNCNEYAKISAGSFFGELEVLDGVKRRCYAKAVDQTQLLFCSKDKFLQAIREFPTIEDEVNSIAQRRKEKFFEKKRPVADPSNEAPKLLNATDYFSHVYQNFYKNRQSLFVKPNFLPSGTILKILPKNDQPKKARGVLDILLGRLSSASNNNNNNTEAPVAKAVVNPVEQSQMDYHSTVGSGDSDAEDNFEPVEYVDQILVSKNNLADHMIDKPHQQEVRSAQHKGSVIEVFLANKAGRGNGDEKEPLNDHNLDAGSQQGQGSSKPMEEANIAGPKKISKLNPLANIKARMAALNDDQNRITEQDEGNGDTDSPYKPRITNQALKKFPPNLNP